MLARFRRGDRTALERVFREHAADVARALRAGVVVIVDGAPTRIGSHPPEHELEVLMQETFVRAFSPRARESYDGQRPFAAYIVTIARNLLIDRARKKKREAIVVSPDSTDADAVSVDSGAVARVEEQRLSSILTELKAALSPRELAVYQARFEEERSLRETATVLSLGIIAVRRIDLALRTKILERLRDEGYMSSVDIQIPSAPGKRNRK